MKAATQRSLRRVHLYLGMFFAPAILFFAISGAMQTFRLSELPGAPAWTQWLASIHKDQAAPRPKPPRDAAAPARARPDRPRAPRHDPLALKIFVAVMALGLTLSTGLGMVIALSLPALRRGATIALAAGTLLPLALLLA